MISRLEHLPNETLLYIFSFMSCHDIIHSGISNMNRRFQCLIMDIRVDLFQIDRLSKEDFDRISLELFPSNMYSLSLSNVIIPDQIKRFFSMIDIRKLERLTSLTLNQPTEFDLKKILLKLFSLPQLSLLKIDTKFNHIVSKMLSISSQSNTTLLKLILINSYEDDPIVSTENLFNIFSIYSSLEYLTIDLCRTTYCSISSVAAYKLKYLKITSIEFVLNQKIISCIPNIQHLSYTATQISIHEINGSYLKDLLVQLKRLKKLDLFLSHYINDVVDQVKRSYQTDFWLTWNVNINTFNDKIYVYTIPYPLNDLRISTDIHQSDMKIFKKVKKVNLELCNTVSISTFQCLMHSNINSLQILSNEYYSVEIPKSFIFNNLVQLTISNPCLIDSQFYLSLFEQSPNLISLNIMDYNLLVKLTNTFCDRSMCLLLQKKIQKLTINNWNDKFFEIFSNLQMLICPYDSIENLYLILPKLFNVMKNLVVIKFQGLNLLDNKFQEDFRIWLTKNTSMANTKNTVVRCYLNTITIWNGQSIDTMLL